MQRMMAAFFAQEKHNRWVEFLPKKQFNLNTQLSSCKFIVHLYDLLAASKQIPYEVMFTIKVNTGTAKSFVELQANDKNTDHIEVALPVIDFPNFNIKIIVKINKI